MTGIINCFKPEGLTSFDIVKILRKILSIRKIGHSGTLDPMAEGVLPVFLNKAVKLIEYQTEFPKIYRAGMVLGLRTDTQDKTGHIIEEKKVENISIEKIKSVFKEFTGIIYQIPPMYSALNYKGEKLYSLARKGIEISRKPRKIEIYELSFLHYSCEYRPLVSFEVKCSSGTYVRTLCEDIGLRLGCGGHLNSLLRVSTGSFDISSSFTIEDIKSFKEKGELHRVLLPMSYAVAHMGSIGILPEYEYMISQGRRIYYKQISNKLDNVHSGQKVCIYNNKNELLAISKAVVTDSGDIYFQPLKVLLEMDGR